MGDGAGPFLTERESTMKIRTIGAAGAIIVLAALSVTATAGAQTQYPTNATTVTVNRTEVPAGGTVEVSGNASPNSTVSFSLPARVLGTALTNNAGQFRAGVTIPCETPQGPTTLRTTGPGIDASTGLNIVGETAVCPADVATTATGGGGGGGFLPRTGSTSTAPLAAAGIGLVLIGGATAITARRRRSAESA